MNNNPVLKETTNLDDDFMLIMIPYFAEIITANVTEQVRILRFTAMKEVQKYLRHYQELGYVSQLISAIAE